MLDRHAVHALLKAGQSTKEIAQQFGVTRRTIQRIAKEPPVEDADDAEARRRHRVVTSLGGEIRVESKVGKGTTIQVLLPIYAGEAPTQAKPAVAPITAPRRGRVLIIDDDATVAAVLRRVLAPEHDVDAVNAASVALDRIAGGERFDVIICDLMMPQLAGMDFWKRLSRVAPEQESRIVLMTGGAFTPAARAFLDQVPNPCIEKPFDVHNLRLIVRVLLAG